MANRFNRWTAEEVIKMNEETFMVEVLDMIKFSPELDETDAGVAATQKKLDAIEQLLQARLNAKQSN
ncbi:MAG: hypothetical protein ACK4L8_02930 [Nitrincola lacisaponensis]|uniref:Uncharacterized protein n=1 Tax=Nitrincola lacisaponensis TaxID=267850 RepID=A0A063Y2L3_9GAMM|nr:hypothetical protein [Nitrincola lacisaponensis]KDE40543.1 hypothetical protein ADINL_1135 [Nitrincola lacisaponensis]